MFCTEIYQHFRIDLWLFFGRNGNIILFACDTFAWFTSSDEVTNRLTASADYGVSIVETFTPPEQWVPGQEINKDVYATNTGNIDAYVEETVSGVYTITYENVVDKFGVSGVTYVELTDADDITAKEAGGYLLWNNAGVANGPINSKRDADLNGGTKWTPTATGDYLFRRYDAPVNSDDAYAVEGYHYDAGTDKYYKIYLDANKDIVANNGTTLATGRTTLAVTKNATTGLYELATTPTIKYVATKTVANQVPKLTFEAATAGDATLTKATTDTESQGDRLLPIKTNITDSDGKLKIEFTNSAESLDWNKNYYFVELAAPKGYKPPDNYVFPFKLKDKVDNRDTDIKQTAVTSSNIELEWNIKNERQLGNVTLVKYKGDAYGNKGDTPEKLAGATFRLLDGNGAVVQNQVSGDNAIKVNGVSLAVNDALDENLEKNSEIIMKTDSNGELKIENLPWGRNYRLVEVDSGDPNLDTVEIKKFTIDKNHLTIDKEAVDPQKTDTLTLQKEIDEWNPAFGDATFIFKVKKLKTDADGTISITGESANYAYDNQEFTKMVTFNAEDNGNLSEALKFSNLSAGAWYEVSEIPVARYQLESITGVTVKNENNTDKPATVIQNIDVSNRKCYVQIVSDGSNTVKFVNHLKYYDQFTENATKNNNVEKDVMVAGVHFNINANLLNHPETLSLQQSAPSVKTYNFLEALTTPETINGKTVTLKYETKNGKRVYPSDAFEVYISVDDPNVSDIRVYPQGHELYDPTVGYYQILPTVDVYTNDTDNIITFKFGENDMATHRAVAIEPDGIRTKGDANETEDASLVTEAIFVGKTIFHIPKVGYLIMKLRSRNGIIMLIAFMILLVLIGRLLEPQKQEDNEN